MGNIDNIDDIAQLLTDFRLDINHVSQGDFSPEHMAYSCTLTYGQSSIPVTFQQHQSQPAPTTMDIIESIVQDAQSYNDYDSIDDFASEFGYTTADTPVSKILNIFNSCKEYYEWLCRNDGYPIYQHQLPQLSHMLDEYHDEISEKVKVLETEKQAVEAYNNPPVPEGFVSLKKLMTQFDCGMYGEQVTDYDNTIDLSDAFSEIADNNVDIYYSDLLKWLPENYEWLEEADSQGLLDGAKGDLIKMTQLAQYVCYEQDLYDHMDDILSYGVAHQLYSYGVYMVSDDIADKITNIGSDFDDIQSSLDDLLDTIKVSLSETFDKQFDDAELAEKMAEDIIDNNFTQANPYIMSTATARSVAELGYDQAFQKDWEDYLRDQHIENQWNPFPHTSTPSRETNLSPYALLDRLKSDCDYYLGACLENSVDMTVAQKHLWAGTIERQIDKMRELYNGLPEKPEWLSLSDINQYEKKMLTARDNDSPKNSISTLTANAKLSSQELNSTQKSVIDPRMNEQEK